MSAAPQLHAQDLVFLHRAVALSRQAVDSDAGGPFGAVIVKDGNIIAEGWNMVTSTFDPTAHAEINAIRKAAQELGTFSLAGATLYSSCEPCPMCLAAIYWARLDRLVYANAGSQAAASGFDDGVIYEELGKLPAQRRLRMVHIPLQDAQEAFTAWAQKANRIDY